VKGIAPGKNVKPLDNVVWVRVLWDYREFLHGANSAKSVVS